MSTSLACQLGSSPSVRFRPRHSRRARRVYDRHQFIEEKRDALEKLNALVERILPGGGDAALTEKGRPIARAAEKDLCRALMTSPS